MDKCSYFIKNRAMFGSFPTQEAVKELEEHGVRYFVDLTHFGEDKTTPYKTAYNYINYPITDRRIPTNWQSFANFIIKTSKLILSLKNGDVLYVHCKGGHGRSGIVVAALLCFIFKISPEEALQRTAKYHQNRSVMREKWRKLGSPQTFLQKNFIHKFFEPLHFYRAHKPGYLVGFSNFSLYPVDVPGIGVFPTAEAAFQAHKNLDNIEYVESQKNAETPMISKYIGKKVLLRSDWYMVQDSIMQKILRLKIEQNLDIKNTLINTGLRPIIEHTRIDNYWGDGGDGSGQNRLGKMITSLRNSLYEEMQ